MEYSAEVRQRFLAPTRAGEFSPESAQLLSGSAEDRSLGVWVRFQVQFQNATIRRVRFRAFGCPHTLAMAEYLAGSLEGKPLAALGQLDLDRVAAENGLPREKQGKLLRLEDALLACRAQALAATRD